MHQFGHDVFFLGVGGRTVRRISWRYDDRSLTIPLSKFEIRHVHMLRELKIRWDRILDNRALALLDNGLKLEVEGAVPEDTWRDIERALRSLNR
jgi:hypothetical protein